MTEEKLDYTNLDGIYIDIQINFYITTNFKYLSYL